MRTQGHALGRIGNHARRLGRAVRPQGIQARERCLHHRFRHRARVDVQGGAAQGLDIGALGVTHAQDGKDLRIRAQGRRHLVGPVVRGRHVDPRPLLRRMQLTAAGHVFEDGPQGAKGIFEPPRLRAQRRGRAGGFGAVRLARGTTATHAETPS